MLDDCPFKELLATACNVKVYRVLVAPLAVYRPLLCVLCLPIRKLWLTSRRLNGQCNLHGLPKKSNSRSWAPDFYSLREGFCIALVKGVSCQKIPSV